MLSGDTGQVRVDKFEGALCLELEKQKLKKI